MRSRSPYYLFFFAAIPALLVLQNPRISQGLHGLSLALLKPFLVSADAAQNVAVSGRECLINFWKTFRDQSRMQVRLEELESKVVLAGELQRENERLKKLLAFKDSIAGRKIAARVIGWDSSPWRKTIILDKGEKGGLKKEMAVVVPEGVVGRILEIGPVTARVILLPDPDARVGAITEQSRAQGVVAGDSSPKLHMQYLTLDSGAAVDETVLTSGVGGIFPKGLRIGAIEAISRDSGGLHLIARIRPFVSFSKLEEVVCLESSQAK